MKSKNLIKHFRIPNFLKNTKEDQDECISAEMAQS